MTPSTQTVLRARYWATFVIRIAGCLAALAGAAAILEAVAQIAGGVTPMALVHLLIPGVVWLVGGAMVFGAAVHLARVFLPMPRAGCPSCGYPITKTSMGRCPECGTKIEAA